MLRRIGLLVLWVLVGGCVAGDTQLGTRALEMRDGDGDGDPGGPPACDVDGDGYRAVSCGGDDCDDNNADVHPGDGCDGSMGSCGACVTPGCATALCVPGSGGWIKLCDDDRDGYWSVACGGDDCDDNNPDVYPGNGC